MTLSIQHLDDVIWLNHVALINATRCDTVEYTLHYEFGLMWSMLVQIPFLPPLLSDSIYLMIMMSVIFSFIVKHTKFLVEYTFNSSTCQDSITSLLSIIVTSPDTDHHSRFFSPSFFQIFLNLHNFPTCLSSPHFHILSHLCATSTIPPTLKHPKSQTTAIIKYP